MGNKRIFTQFPGVFWTANTLELFERWAYYGIFNLLALYLTNSTESGALGFTQVQKGLIMGIVNAILYFLPVVTGSIADRFGYKRVLIIAFVILSSGYYLMGQVSSFTFVFITFFYVAIGAALFKPIISATIAKTTNNRTSSLGFGIFYMMVNIGGLVGPYVGSELRERSWNYVFIMSAAAILFNLVLVILLYKEPDRNNKLLEPLGKALKGSLLNIWYAVKDFKFLLFLLIIGGIWTIFWQLFYSLPVFIEQWSNTHHLYNFLHQHLPFLARVLGTSDGIILPEKLIMLDAFFIVLFQVIVSSLVRKFKPLLSMIAGIIINTAGIAFAFITMNPFLLVLSIFIFGIGEMIFSPKILEYIARIAPRDKSALYMGAQFVSIALGNFLGGFLSGGLYDRLANRDRFLESYTGEFGIASLEGLSREEINSTLWQHYHPEKFGFTLLAIGLATAFLLILYNYFLSSDQTGGEKTDQYYNT
ncbi:MAG: MFS transporter [Bacteroidales bacterium]|nr:MFS transporter [Bacteroidales bacterium]MBN2697603.1 MFS transporter [Bacteroidales bacterium]